MKTKLLKILVFLLIVSSMLFAVSCTSNKTTSSSESIEQSATTHVCDFSILKEDDANHWYECNCGKKTEQTAHYGGNATCTQKAVCEVCSQTYFGLGLHNFENDTCTVCSLGASTGLEYELRADGCSYIVTGIGECLDTELIIPSTYNGLPVIEIKERAFSDNDKINSLIISDSIVVIGKMAFLDCDNLYRVVVGKKVSYIWEDAFDYCNHLVEVINKSNNITIESWIFEYGNMLGYHAVSIFNSGDVYVNRFTNDDDYIVYTAKNGEKILVRYEGVDTNIVIPSYIDSIWGDAFIDNDEIKSVVIPDSVECIGAWSFFGCDNLTFVKIGDGVVKIESHAFADCKKLEKIIVGGKVEVIGDDAFIRCDGLTEVYFKEDVSDSSKILDGNNVERIYYYIEIEEDVPTDGGNYWHYDKDGTPVVW